MNYKTIKINEQEYYLVPKIEKIDLNFEWFENAANVVERIINDHSLNIEEEIRNSSNNISIENKRQFYRHMNALFLNVLLNRLNSTPKDSEERAIESRRVICQIINTL
jgi:hypothetical protein